MEDIFQSHGSPEIYIVAHSEGTVVTFLGLLRALSKDPRPAWVKNVRGLMTIGSPINKHIILWPELVQEYLKPAAPRAPLVQPIQWRNYYDFGDPVGFRLDATWNWLRENDWITNEADLNKQPFFAFDHDNTKELDDDIGFTRYPFPGKAHNDYWNDDDVFGHFIQTVVQPTDKTSGNAIKPPKDYKANPPRSNRWCYLSPVLPYALVAGLIFAAVYLLYKGVCEFLGIDDEYLVLLRNVIGLATLLGALTVGARIPRLTMLRKWRLIAWLIVLAGAAQYSWVVVPETRILLGWWVTWFGIEGNKLYTTYAVIAVVVILAFILPLIGGRSAYWSGTRLLIIAAGLVIAGIVGSLVAHVYVKNLGPDDQGPVWPLFLASAAFLYLWWLAALIFDLAFVWHRYIRYSVIEDHLQKLALKDEFRLKLKEPKASTSA
jgi:hypothetical protein